MWKQGSYKEWWENEHLGYCTITGASGYEDKLFCRLWRYVWYGKGHLQRC